MKALKLRARLRYGTLLVNLGYGFGIPYLVLKGTHIQSKALVESTREF